MSDLGKELQRIEQGEAWDESDEVVQVEVKRPLEKVVPIRLAASDWAKLREEARELGVGPTTLARMLILERLRLPSISSQNAFRESTISSLTPREAEILYYIAQGYANKQVAENLCVSEVTVKRKVTAILRKLNAEHERRIHDDYKHRV